MIDFKLLLKDLKEFLTNVYYLMFWIFMLFWCMCIFGFIIVIEIWKKFGTTVGIIAFVLNILLILRIILDKYIKL